MEVILITVSVLVGAVIGRWWAVVLAVPFGVWLAYEAPIENATPPYWDLGLAVSVLAGTCIAGGVWLRRSHAGSRDAPR